MAPHMKRPSTNALRARRGLAQLNEHEAEAEHDLQGRGLYEPIRFKNYTITALGDKGGCTQRVTRLRACREHIGVSGAGRRSRL